MISLIDADIVCYRAGFASEHTKYIVLDEEGRPFAGPFDSAAEKNAWVKETYPDTSKFAGSVESYKEYEPLSHALHNVKSIIEGIYDVIGKGHLFLSKGNCFRHDIATMLKYKGNRDDTPKPKYYHEIREYMMLWLCHKV